MTRKKEFPLLRDGFTFVIEHLGRWKDSERGNEWEGFSWGVGVTEEEIGFSYLVQILDELPLLLHVLFEG